MDRQTFESAVDFVLERGEFEALIAGAPDGVVVVNSSGGIVYANTTLEELFGYGPGQLEHVQIADLIPVRARTGETRTDARSMPQAEAMEAGSDLTGHRLDGTEFPVDVRLIPTKMRDGLLVTAFVRDVTEQKRFEEELLASEERLRLLVENVADHALYVLDPQGYVASWNEGAQRLKGYTASEILGQHVSAFYTAEDRARGEPDRALDIAAQQGRYWSEGWRVRKDGRRFRAHVSITRLDDPDGVLKGFVRVAHDVTDAYRLMAVAELTQAILGGEATASVLEMTSGYARSIVNARLAWVVGPFNGSPQLRVLATSGEGIEELIGAVVANDSIPAAVMDANEVISMESMEEESYGLSEELLNGLGPVLFVPLHHGEDVLGVLVVAHNLGDPPCREDEIGLIKLFADQAAIALHTSQLRGELERVSLLAQRERIARDLHDTVIQRLFATGMSLQASLPLATSPPLRVRIEQSITDLDDTIRNIRTTIFDLQQVPAATGTSRARAQILEVTADATRGLGFNPTVRFAGAVDAAVGEHSLAELIATLREALSNVARHAHARGVEVAVVVGKDVVLTVTDDGVGISKTRNPGSKGLANMRERAELLGGGARFDAVPNGGTQVVWRVPIG